MADAAHAVVSVVSGPRVPSAIDVSAAPMFEMRAVTQNGFSRSGPASKSFAYATSCVRRPPIPVPIEHPIRAASAAMSRSASATACVAAATASCAKRSVFLTDFRSMYSSGSKPFTWPAIFGVPSGTTNSSMRETPDRPERMPSQVSSIVFPHGVIPPSPVMTTRRRPFAALMSPILRRPQVRGPSRTPRRRRPGTARRGPRRRSSPAARAASTSGSPHGPAPAARR